jgi:hypothetical protein
LWVLISNTALVLLYVYGIHSELAFYHSIDKYGSVPLPLGRALAQILEEKAWGLLAALLLVWGAEAEYRGRRAAVIVNPVAYAMIVAIFVWDCASLAISGHREHLLPYVLEDGVPSVLIPAAILTLYRSEIASLIKRNP